MVVAARSAVAPLRAAVGWNPSLGEIMHELGELGGWILWAFPWLPVDMSLFLDAHLLAVCVFALVPLVAKTLLFAILCKKPKTGVDQPRKLLKQKGD